ncbi:glycosylated S-layer protein, SlaA, partial [Sulfolobus sp. D5]
MNKTLGLILASVFLISTLGIIPSLMLTTEAAIPSSNPASPTYTVPKVIQLPNTSTSYINLFFNIYSNSTVAKVAQAFDYGLADNYTAEAITFTVSVKGGPTGTFKLNQNDFQFTYFYYNNASVAIVLSPTGSSTTPSTGTEAVSTFEINSLGVISNLYNYLNKTVYLNGTINVLSLNYIIYQAVGNMGYTSLASLPAGSTIQISYAGYTYTITVVHIVTYPGQLVNPIEVAGVIPNPGYVQAVGRSNITIGVYDPAITTGTTPFNFTLTYTSQAPAVIEWFVVANATNASSNAYNKDVTANFYAPKFVGSFLPMNNSIVYEPSSQTPFLQFNGNLNVTAHENVTGTLQSGTNIYVGELNVTPPGHYYFSGELNTIFNGFLYTNGSATLRANIFNGTIFFFLPHTGVKENFTFFITPVVPINLTSNISAPISSLIVDNGMNFYVGFPSLIVAFTITANFTTSGGNYLLYGSVNEYELNSSSISNIIKYNVYNFSFFNTYLQSALSSPLVHFFNFGEATTTILGTSLSFNVLMPLKFIVMQLGYIFLVIFHIWGPSATVTVTGVDYKGDKIVAGNFRAYIALPTYYTTPPSSIDYLTCDNQYTLVQIKDAGSVLDTIQNNVMFNNPSTIGPWDKVSSPPLASYYAAGLHVAIYNGTKLKFNTTVGPLPNATTTPVSFTISLQGQVVPFTYSTIPSGVYPIAFKFEPGTSYMVTTNLITNSSVPEYVVTVYVPLQYLLNTKIVIFYVSPDFATLFYYNTTGQFHTSNVTISFANVTPQLVMPSVFPVGKLYMPFGVNDSYYEFYSSISLGPINGII